MDPLMTDEPLFSQPLAQYSQLVSGTSGRLASLHEQ
jgi:hypothetical protein